MARISRRGGLMSKAIPALVGLVVGVLFGDKIKAKVPFLSNIVK